ncbi:MAG: efflux RND transporter permease subunit [Gammaproteobacteria bacterium]
MILSDISVRRPVLASVMSLLLIAFGLLAYQRLPLREYPDIDPPIVSIETQYPGAAANVVESRITEIVEESISGIEGIRFIESRSEDGESEIDIEFNIDRDVDDAANDIRDRVSGIVNELPEEAIAPEIQKVDSSDDVIMWFNLTGKGMSIPELTDYADRYLVDRFSVLDGVARIRIGGDQTYAMRIWLDRNALAARGLTATDVEDALLAENVELPAGSMESEARQITVRMQRAFSTPESFASLVLAQGEDGYLVRLGDVARVERGAVESRNTFRGNGIPMVGIGVVKQSTANTLDVTRAAGEEAERINAGLPEGMRLEESFDTSVFIEGAVNEVYKTLFIAMLLVVFVIYLFLGSLRAMIVPAVTVPVSLTATFLALLLFGFSVNLLTLLALVLAIGLVVDDAIVVLENIHRRMDEHGETRLVAAFRGSRQVAFAVVATTVVLISVFVPIAFMQGDVGRLFSEFALTLAAAVAFSAFVALSLSPMMSSKLLKPPSERTRLTRALDNAFARARDKYVRALRGMFRHLWLAGIVFLAILLGVVFLFPSIEREYVPEEDRGAFFVMVDGPEGATYEYMADYMDEIEARMMPMVESGEMTRLLVRAPRAFGNYSTFNSGFIIVGLADWGERRPAEEIMDDVSERLADLPGVRASPIMRQGFGGGIDKPVELVLGGASYEDLTEWRDILMREIEADNPGFEDIDWDYKETKPQMRVVVDYDRAADLGVTVSNVGRTLETMLGSRRVTTYIDNGEEYDVILEGERDLQRTPTSLENIYVRSERSEQLISLSNVVELEEFADSLTLNRYNRVRAITMEANLAEGFALGEAVDHLELLVDEHLPDEAIVDWKGQSQDFKTAAGSVAFVFALGIVVVFLVLAAQFESYVHPFVIMLTVPLAIVGALLGLWLTGQTLNIFSQIGLVMLVGLSAKNGILIVEFANQMRDQGLEFDEALIEASRVRLRPIVMTGITTAAGAVPLIVSFGPGSESRQVLGIVILTGVLAATFFTLFIVPAAYHLFARHTGSVGDVSRRLETELEAT